MRRIILSSILLIAFCLLVTGCNEPNKDSLNKDIKSNGEQVDLSKTQHKICKGSGHIDNNSQANMTYDIYYKNNVIYLLRSNQQIISTSEETLNTYEESFKGISEHYKGLEYYDTEIVKNETSVDYTITINYEKIDIDKLLDIEGEEDNIVENGKAKLDKWLTLSQQFGVKCEEAEDV